MYGDQFGEFEYGYWVSKVDNRTPRKSVSSVGVVWLVL